MHPQTLFSAAGKLAMAGWALLVFAPRWRWSQRIASAIIPLTLAIVYLVLIVLYFAKSPGGFGTLAQVAQLFQNPWLLLAGWIHYLAFDLFLGAWQARQDSAKIKRAQRALHAKTETEAIEWAPQSVARSDASRLTRVSYHSSRPT